MTNFKRLKSYGNIWSKKASFPNADIISDAINKELDEFKDAIDKKNIKEMWCTN